MIEFSIFVEVVIVLLVIPVLCLSFYWCFDLLVSSLKYPRDLEEKEVQLARFPNVSILISSFNEKFVIARSLEAMEKLDYPKDKVQIIVADDSTDESVQIIDEKVRELNGLGLNTIVSRRPTRENFKCGALNQAMNYVTGEYVLLFDADSIVPPEVFSKGIDAMETHPNASFVSFRYGHYNRNYNLTTKIFALAQDLADTTSKMGAYLVDAPFSFQGGFTLVRTGDLKDVGQWTNGRIADDTDVSIKFYLKGKRGIYLSNVSIMSEDPSSIEAWKRQVARTSQGWWRCIAKYWRQIILARDVPLRRKLGIFMMLAATYSSLNWLLITFLSAFAIVFDVISPTHSIFANPAFIVTLAIPYVVVLMSAAWALKVQNLLTLRNLTLIPMLIYTEVSVVTLSSLGFFYGVFDRTGFFNYRTPKQAASKTNGRRSTLRAWQRARNGVTEGALSVTGAALGVLVMFHGVYFLSLAMVGFALATLKSMNLTKRFRSPAEVQAGAAAPDVTMAAGIEARVEESPEYSPKTLDTPALLRQGIRAHSGHGQHELDLCEKLSYREGGPEQKSWTPSCWSRGQRPKVRLSPALSKKIRSKSKTLEGAVKRVEKAAGLAYPPYYIEPSLPRSDDHGRVRQRRGTVRTRHPSHPGGEALDIGAVHRAAVAVRTQGHGRGGRGPRVHALRGPGQEVQQDAGHERREREHPLRGRVRRRGEGGVSREDLSE